MAQEEVDYSYDYSATEPFLEPFKNPLEDEPFISEMIENYGKLWQFKDVVHKWSFGVNRLKDYVYFRHKEQGSTNWLIWCINEKVTLIEHHQNNFLVLVLQEVDNNGRLLAHLHSTVIKVGAEHGQFDIEELIVFLPRTSLESLAQDFQDKFCPWRSTSASSEVRKVAQIFTTLDRYAMKNVERTPTALPSRVNNTNAPDAQTTSGSGAPLPANRGSGRGLPQSSPWKQKLTEFGLASTSQKRSKPSHPRQPKAIESSGSALTTVQGGAMTVVTEVPDHEKFAEYQRLFWQQHKSCYLFKKNTYPISIKQCILARDEYIIRKLEASIVEDVKKELVMLGDASQRQKICVTPVDLDGNLLTSASKKWEDIENGQFMIINGEHSITASKQLQEGGCGESRRVELQTWDASIVWTKDAVQLTNISKFYNSTNYLNHAQPTWGNQIINCRNIWISYNRPCTVSNEAATRKNDAVANITQYTKFTTLIVSRFQNINPEKDEANIKGPADVKSKIRIITLADDIFALWEEFLINHAKGKLIDPLTNKPYKASKAFNGKSNSLKREFFKHMGHFTDKDFKAYVLHMLGKTPSRVLPYPKLSVNKSKILAPENQAGLLVERELGSCKTTL